MHYAAFSGSDGIVKLLLSKKADATLTAGVGFLEFARNLTVKVASPSPSPSSIPSPLLCLSGENTRQCILGSNPEGNAIFGLSYWYSPMSPENISPDTPVFPSPLS